MTYPQSRHREDETRGGGVSKRTLVIVVAAFAVVLSIVATAWAIAGQRNDNTQTTDPEPTRSGESSSETTSADAEGDDKAALKPINTCADALDLADQAIAAAESGVEHWEEHIQAHTDFIEGEIDSADADEVFERTSSEGPDDLAKFDKARKAYQKVADDCDGLEDLEVSDRYAPALERCRFYASAAQSAVDAGRATIDDWRDHLADERKHDEGALSDEEAQQKWIEAWRNGGPRITTFHTAVDQRDATPTCTTPTPAVD